MLVVDLGVDVTWANRIDVDAVFAPFHSHGLGHMDHRRLAHAINADLGQYLQAGHGSDVHDATADIRPRRRAFGPGQHALGHFLRHEEGALGVGVQHEVVVFLAHILQALGGADARVVDEDVNATHLGFRMGDGRLDRCEIGDIQRHHMRVATIGFDVRAQSHQAVRAPPGQHHRGTRLGQGLGKLFTQAARSARDQRDAPCQIQAVSHLESSLKNAVLTHPRGMRDTDCASWPTKIGRNHDKRAPPATS